MNTTWIPQDLYHKSVWETAITTKSGLVLSRHPLCCDILLPKKAYEDMGVPTPNDAVRRKLELIVEASEQRDGSRYVFWHCRPFRFQALLDAKPWMAEEEWYALAGDVWIDSEGPGVNSQLWREVFESPLIRFAMDVSEVALLGSLPREPVTCYRGAGSRRLAAAGFSWTLDREKAIWFAHRFSPKAPWLAEVVVQKEEIRAIFLGRGEKECIILNAPDHHVEVHRCPKK